MIKLSSFEGGGGYYSPTGQESDSILAGQTGVLLSLSEVDGIIYNIKLLCTNTQAEDNITLIVDGETIEDSKTLDDNTAAANTDAFLISRAYVGSSVAGSARQYSNLYCKSFSVVKDSGNTVRNINYAYEIGRFK